MTSLARLGSPLLPPVFRESCLTLCQIADFGVSHLFEGENDRVRDTHGSAAFMAPEMCEGSAEFSGRVADVWSAGVTLFVFVFGRLPFIAETVHLIYQSIAQDE